MFLGFFIVALSLSGQLEFRDGSGAGLLDEAVEENDGLVVDKEQGAGDAGWQARADLPESPAKRADERETKWPAKLCRKDVDPDLLPFGRRQAFQPFANRFVAGGRAKENARKRTQFRHAPQSVSK